METKRRWQSSLYWRWCIGCAASLYTYSARATSLFAQCAQSVALACLHVWDAQAWVFTEELDWPVSWAEMCSKQSSRDAR